MSNSSDYIGNYKIIKTIGKGSFGIVYLTEKIGEPNVYYAIKAINIRMYQNAANKAYFQNLDREIDILKQINNKHVIKMYEHFKIADYYYIVMEYCQGRDMAYIFNNYKELFKPKLIKLIL